jgi:hypothetical protein
LLFERILESTLVDSEYGLLHRVWTRLCIAEYWGEHQFLRPFGVNLSWHQCDGLRLSELQRVRQLAVASKRECSSLGRQRFFFAERRTQLLVRQ